MSIVSPATARTESAVNGARNAAGTIMTAMMMNIARWANHNIAGINGTKAKIVNPIIGVLQGTAIATLMNAR